MDELAISPTTTIIHKFHITHKFLITKLKRKKKTNLQLGGVFARQHTAQSSKYTRPRPRNIYRYILNKICQITFFLPPTKLPTSPHRRGGERGDTTSNAINSNYIYNSIRVSCARPRHRATTSGGRFASRAARAAPNTKLKSRPDTHAHKPLPRTTQQEILHDGDLAWVCNLNMYILE